MIIRSGYSFNRAYGHLEDVAKRLTALGWARQPLSDTVSTFGFARWNKLVPAPIYGCELPVVPELATTIKAQPLDYWSFFAINELKALHQLIGLATSRNNIAQLTYNEALEAPGLIKIAGHRCQTNCIPAALPPDFYFGLTPAVPMGLYRLVQQRGWPLLAAGDNVYPVAEDKELYRIVLGRRANVATFPQHILSDDEWSAACAGFAVADRAAALNNRAAAMAQCTAQLEKATIFEPQKPQTLREMCLSGATRKRCDLNNPVYAARLDRELKLIAEKQFEDYFYILADIIGWAKQRMIVGPARGSSCGSLVCYLLDITAIDPIPYELIFERFIDITRADLPDIDVDFDDTKRELVFDYVVQQYGRERVARLGTVSTLMPRSLLKAAGPALRIPQWRIDKVADSLIVRSLGDSRARQQFEDTMKDTEEGRAVANDFPNLLHLGRAEGHPSNAGQHSAGICITKDQINRYVAVDQRSWAAMCDKKDAEQFGLLKIDALGLTQLSTFARTLEMIGRPALSSELEAIPVDDTAAFAVLNAKKFSGVFQFEGKALQSLAKQIEIDSIWDIIALSALGRPGPMASGGATHWVRRRNGSEPVSYPHPAFEPFLKDTLGVVMYQETIMQLGREIGDLDWEDVTTLRKAMSKSLGVEWFDAHGGEKWKANAIKKGIPPAVANQFWSDMCQMGSWSFNRAHAVAYGLVSYYCCWFKAHYPLQFAAATLDAEGLPLRQVQILRELAAEGVAYKPVDAKQSTERWSIGNAANQQYLLGPLTSIKGIGLITARKIIAARANGSKLTPSIAEKLRNAKTDIDSLLPVTDALKALHPDLRAIKIETLPTPIIQAQCGVNHHIVIIGVVTKIGPRDENEAVNIAKRKGRVLTGPTLSLNLFVRDDTDEIFVKVNRWDYEAIGRPIVETGRPGKSIYAFKGTVPAEFRMLRVDQVKYLGELDKAGFAPDQHMQAAAGRGDIGMAWGESNSD